MKKMICCFFILIMMTISSIGCGSKTEEPVLPPTRLGTKGTSSASLEREYGFESAFSEADFVAHIKVGNWLAENTEIMSTYYEAQVVHQYKGDETKDFILIQDGDSEFTLEGYPLFTYGNELLVFCKRAVDVEYTDAYWIIGSFTTVMDAVTAKSGEVYFMDRYGMLGDRSKKLINYKSQQPELRSMAEKNDSIVSDMDYAYPYVFSVSDVEAFAVDQ